MKAHQAEHAVERMCGLLGVSTSGYYAWRNEPLSLRKVADMVLLQHIRDIFEEGRQTYGSARIQGILADQGIACGRERVARLMRQEGLSGRRQRRFKILRLTAAGLRHVRSAATAAAPERISSAANSIFRGEGISAVARTAAASRGTSSAGAEMKPARKGAIARFLIERWLADTLD